MMEDRVERVPVEIGDIIVLEFGQENLLGEVTNEEVGFLGDMLEMFSFQTGNVAPWFHSRVLQNYGKRVR